MTGDDFRDRRDVTRWIRTSIRELAAYRVADAQGLVKLDAMENPYRWPPEMTARWLEMLAGVPLNRYPDAGAGQLRRRLAEVYGVPPGRALLLGNGSDELIQIILLAVGGRGRTVLAPAPSFTMYRMSTVVTGGDFVGVPLDSRFALDTGAMLDALRTRRPACTFIAYPNNPTGNCFDRAAIDAIIDASEGLVIIDEAYQPFCDDSYLGRPDRGDHVLVMRTLSKMGLAGLRIGFLCGHSDWLGQFDKIRLPYNVNRLSQATALFALDHAQWFDAAAARVRAERERLVAALGARPGVEPYPSQANFVLFRLHGRDPTAVFESIRAGGVLVKNLHGSDPLLDGCLRVTVGTTDEVERFLTALDRALEQVPALV